MSFIEPKENELYKDYINRILNSRPNTKLDDVYQERHHITPKCLGGLNDKDNLIYLYAQEHYYAHKLLALENPNENGLQYAWWNMCTASKYSKRSDSNITPEDYSIAKERISKHISVNRIKENNPNYGKHFTKEHREKIGKSRIGVPRSEETKRKVSENHADVSGINNPNCKKVRCIEYNIIFPLIKNAMEWAGLKDKNAIPQQIKGKRNSAGKHPITKEKLHWEYVN